MSDCFNLRVPGSASAGLIERSLKSHVVERLGAGAQPDDAVGR